MTMHQNTANTILTKSVKRLLPFYLCLLFPFISRADLTTKYTERHPVVIECDISYPPYEFLSEKGLPDGYFIDLTTTLLYELGIPFQISPQESSMGRVAFLSHKADLIFDHANDYDTAGVYISKFPIAYYKMVAATRNDSKPLKSLWELTEADVITLKHHDHTERYIQKMQDSIALTIEHHAPREGLASVKSGKSRCYIWGEEPLKWQLRSLQLSDIRLDELELPISQIHFISHNKELIDALDDQYARLQQQGGVQPIRDKWFYPERTESGNPSVILFMLLGLAIVSGIIFLLSRLMNRRLKQDMMRFTDLNNMMQKALDMSQFHVTIHDLKTGMLTNIYNNQLEQHLPKKGLTIKEFVARVPEEERDEFRREMDELISGKVKSREINKGWNAGTEEEPQLKHMHGFAAVEEEHGKPRYIVSTIKDITKEIEEERHDNEQGERFFKLFDTNLVAMSFYDVEGRLIDLNKNMKTLCGLEAENVEYFRNTNMFDASMFKDDVKPGFRDVFHACQRMFYPALNLDKFIEMRIAPSFDEEGNIAYYIVTARDVSAERELHRALQLQEREMRKTSDSISKYEKELEFLLDNSNMFIFKTNIAQRQIYFSQSLLEIQYKWTFEEYFESLYKESLQEATERLDATIRNATPFNAVHHFHYSPIKSKPAWYAISGMPVKDDKGEVIGHFGIVRDVSLLMEANERLRQETLRAENSGRLKSAFLANMSHEIRTPLNAIVGFSDLLPVIDTEEERMEFIRIIRNNCDMLLRLINDILEASNMSAGTITITPEKVDFAQVFNDICQTLEQRVQEPGVQFINDNPYKQFTVTLDKGRMQQVITNFTTNAVKYTHEGHIKVGYRISARPAEGGEDIRELLSQQPPTTARADDGVLMYCEDTGAGIPKEKQASVFERFVKLNDFVQGTGLGLSICKAIADRGNGRIGVTSEGEGHGSTFWIWIPCKVEEIKEK